MQWVAAALFAVVLIALAITVLRVPPRKDRVGDWQFPQPPGPVYFWWQIVPPPTEAAVHFVPNSFTNVTKFYQDRLGIGRAAGATFYGWRSSGIFGMGRRFSSAGFVPHRSEVLTDAFVHRNETQSKIIQVCGRAGSTNTTVWMVMAPTRKGPVVPQLTAVNGAFRYPKRQNSTGGNTSELVTYSDLANAPFSSVTNYYVTNLATNSGPNSLRQQALTMLGEKSNRATFLQLGSTPMPGWPIPTNEAAYLFITSQTLSLIHAVALSNDTRVTVTTVAK